MRCENNFKKLLYNISLKSQRIEKIKAAIASLLEFVSHDKRQSQNEEPGTGDLLIELFIQGSYAVDTCIRPAKEDDEFDVDMALSLLLKDISGQLPSPNTVLDWLKRRLERNKIYKDRIDPQKRCMRIHYSKEFHLDIVPVTPKEGKDGILWIPDKKSGWQETHPKGFINWCNRKEIESGNRFKRVVKYLKWWRSAIAPNMADIKSILLTTLIGTYNVNRNSDAEALVDIMCGIAFWLDNNAYIPEVKHPVLGYNLARNWQQTQYDAFKKSFKEAASSAKAALIASDINESIKLWQKVFGEAFSTEAVKSDSIPLSVSATVFPNKPIIPNKPGGFAC